MREIPKGFESFSLLLDTLVTYRSYLKGRFTCLPYGKIGLILYKFLIDQNLSAG